MMLANRVAYALALLAAAVFGSAAIDGIQHLRSLLGSGSSSTRFFRAIGDFDGNGRSDLIWSARDGTVYIWLMDGLRREQIIELVETPGWHIAAIGDFNGDRRADLLVERDDGSAEIWFMNGREVVHRLTLSGPQEQWRILATADLDGDGRSDVLWVDQQRNVVAWLIDGLSVKSQGLIGNAKDLEWARGR